MITVHMIGNAHIDPVWLWRWPAGMGEVLSTCRTACDLLDADLAPVFTRSDAWVYQVIEEIDPALFQRIKAHVKTGRWAVVGGWYVQPDCNLPREESFLKHIEAGTRYARETLGVTVTTGYNVDSFGHAGSLPRILSHAGYDSYVMMRPMTHEKALPAGLFRWRSPPEAGGPGEVLTWRIHGGYCTSAEDLAPLVKLAIAAAAPGVDHVMCFYGVGDHGGGPTRAQVAWIKANATSIPGARLVFSHPRAFFDAVKPLAAKLPVVEGELQMHAIGCYSVGRSIKRAAREAEHGLIMAEQALAALGQPRPAGDLDRAWEKLLFNQFHDTYGGTAIPAACDDAVAQLGAARDTADQVLARSLFRHATALPPHKSQRIVALNASDAPFDGCLAHEPWLGDWRKLTHWLADESGKAVPTQVVASPSVANMPGVLLWPAQVKPGQVRSWSLERGTPPQLPVSELKADGAKLSSLRWEISAGGPGLFHVTDRTSGRSPFESPRLIVVDDPSDTWSHGIDRFAGAVIGAFEPAGWTIEETGPVRAAARREARFGASTATVWVRLYHGDPRIELELRVDWREKLRVLKLELPMAALPPRRLDGIPGGGAARDADGREVPVIDWTLLAEPGKRGPALAFPDCAALEGDRARLRLTLLRSPAYSWHDPATLPGDRAHRFMDQGEHAFRVTYVPEADAAGINALALGMHRAPLCVDWTRGMEQA